VSTEGSLKIRVSEALNVGARKRGDLRKTGGPEKIRDLGKKGDLEEREGGLESTERVNLTCKNKIHSLFLKVQQDDRK
jgi:hypothetical protein